METNAAADEKSARKKRIVRTLVFALVLVFLGMLVPRAYRYKDGGTVEYKAVLYSVIKWHAFREYYDDGYLGGSGEQQFVVGTTVDILGMRVYHDTHYAYESELIG